ncbi:U3-aranetoxin-Ce1a-like [Lineus longissimus]|uniref:U3-aranetoxin-Ce1a-like n=1 Tax=Lineus longissimus TaxID=88925 RepID=UPI002B4F5D78
MKVAIIALICCAYSTQAFFYNRCKSDNDCKAYQCCVHVKGWGGDGISYCDNHRGMYEACNLSGDTNMSRCPCKKGLSCSRPDWMDGIVPDKRGHCLIAPTDMSVGSGDADMDEMRMVLEKYTY